MIIKACILDFDGLPYEHIAKQLNINKTTISVWKKTDIWKRTQDKLVDAYIEKSLKKKK